MTETSAHTDLAPLLTPEGMALLAELTRSTDYQDSEALALATRLRGQGHNAELVSAVLTQLKLRSQGRGKFGEFAESMLFTQAGLEQASRLSVAARHAKRFADHAVQHVVDLGCGLGGDSMAFAALGLQVTAVEQDDTTAAAATLNLTAFPEARVVGSSAEQWLAENLDALPPSTGFWFDPARRQVSSSGSKRIFDPEAFSPPLSFVESLAKAGFPVGVKLGPGIDHASIPAEAEAQWVSYHGSVVEAVLWFNGLARPNIRRAALMLGVEGSAELSASTDFTDRPEIPVAGVPGVRGFLYEPDGAVIRAGLLEHLLSEIFQASVSEEESPAWLLDEHIAYFCADHQVPTPFATAYRIVEVLPYHVKTLRSWISQRGVTRLDIKKRGVDVVPENLRRTLMSGLSAGQKSRKAASAAGPVTVTLVITRIGTDRIAVVVEPVAPGAAAHH